MTNYFPVVLDQAGHQWLLGLPEDFRFLGRTVPSVYRQFHRYLRAAWEQVRPQEDKGQEKQASARLHPTILGYAS